MRDVERAVRRFIFTHVGRTGRLPSRARLAERLDRNEAWVALRLAALAQAQVLVLDDAGEIAQALPFAAGPTAISIRTESTTYYAPCPLSGFGVAALVGTAADLSIPCASSGIPLAMDAATVFYLVVPAWRWWDDIRRTQRTTLGFASRAHLEQWLETSGEDQGETLDAPTMEALAARWYGRHLDADWQPRNSGEEQAVFTAVGLRGSFWQLVAH